MHINFMKGVEQVFMQIIKLWERASIISHYGTWKTEHIRGGREHYEENLIQIKGTVFEEKVCLDAIIEQRIIKCLFGEDHN